ncbi:P-loop NTPase fold protein [Dokdonia sp. Asnod2-E02]|uniref:KAP family P-loop NTPase fold protein n=1 Tax=Dokdonia sp. Asnod2-E02 TaxID=3160574 RepID=UPI00386EFE4B
MIDQKYTHINTYLDEPPNQFDMAVVSIDEFGSPGTLNRYVLSSLDYDISVLDGINLNQGYYLISGNSVPVLLVSTIGKEFTGILLKRNLTNALTRIYKDFKGKNVWIPLMGTGAGGLEFVDSYDTTVGVLKNFPKINFTISIPDDKKGREFIKLFGQLGHDYKYSSKSSFLDEDRKQLSLANEFEIPELKNIFFGQKIGNELRDYDIFILPKSTLGGIGRNGIAHSVLKILGFDSLSFTFNEKPIYPKGFKWFFRELGNKLVYIGFVFTRDENKNQIDFIDNLKRAINNLKQFEDFKELKEKNLKVFIPLLGAGQAGMNPLLSLRNVIEGIQILRGILPHHKVRINLPLSSSEKDLNDYVHQIAVALSRPPAPPLDLYIKSEEEKTEVELRQNTKDKIPFHLDQVVNEDKLGREPVAREFVRLIKKDIFTEQLNHSFMVHLQGKWGAGKSSFLNFIKKNLNSDGDNWIIVDYNAWQNQHIKPPWWSLIDQVYLKSKEQLYLIGIRASLHLWRKEVFRRIWRYSRWYSVFPLIIFIIGVLSIIYFGDKILDVLSLTSDANSNGKSFISNFGDFLKVVVTLISIGGALFALAKFVTVPLFINSSNEAKSFVLRASDPMNKIKDHFNKLVDDINSKNKNRQLAIFIDDIDRCDKEFIVQLLEGVQTLFKDKRVLYIIAGDKNWISTSYGNIYQDFSNEEVSKKQLGEFFIEKVFQLSFRLPNISEESKKRYWDHILGMKSKAVDNKNVSVSELTDSKKDELKLILKQSKSELTDPDFVQKLQTDFNFSGDTASNVVIEEKNKNTEELKHLLQEYHAYIDTNPRSIIRLANNYTMARTILMAERVVFSEHKLFRWLIIEDLCPEVKRILLNTESTAKFEELIKDGKDISKRDNCLKLLRGDEEYMENAITIEDIKTIKGF